MSRHHDMAGPQLSRNSFASKRKGSGSGLSFLSLFKSTPRSKLIRPRTQDSAIPRNQDFTPISPSIPTLGDWKEPVMEEPLMNDSTSEFIPESVRPINNTKRDELIPPSTNDSGVQLCGSSQHEDARPKTAPVSEYDVTDYGFKNFTRHHTQPSWSSTLTGGSYETSPRPSTVDSNMSFETTASSVYPSLQSTIYDEEDKLDPILEDDPDSFDLVTPGSKAYNGFKIEERAEEMFSTEHLKEIFKEPDSMLQFTQYLSQHRSSSIPLLIYYLDAIKACKALKYSNAIAEALGPIAGVEFTKTMVGPSVNDALVQRAKEAFDVLVRNDLPAFISHTYIQIVNKTLYQRVTGSVPAHLYGESEGLGEVFCLTDPSREGNPIVFASEEFNRMTQYGIDYAIGRNCKFLQGPKTSSRSVQRLQEAIKSGKEVNELLINYRRDGSPFMNLVTVAPLTDSRGEIRYYIGAQVDVTVLCRDCTELEGLQRLVNKTIDASAPNQNKMEQGDEFKELTEMFNEEELSIVQKYGGRMQENFSVPSSERQRLAEAPSSVPRGPRYTPIGVGPTTSLFQNYLLVRPYPSLRIIFTSPSLRTPGILQAQFLSRIGGSERVRNELTSALAAGTGVTARVRWLTARTSARDGSEGAPRWVHCTPLLGRDDGAVGVWMVVIVDEEGYEGPASRFKEAPPVASNGDIFRAASVRSSQARPSTAAKKGLTLKTRMAEDNASEPNLGQRRKA